MYTLTVPFLHPTMIYFLSGERHTALPFAAYEKSFVFLSFYNGVEFSLKFKDAQLRSFLYCILQHLKVASSEHVKIKSPSTHKPHTSLVQLLLGL